MKKYPSIYVPVDVHERLPENGWKGCCILNNGSFHPGMYKQQFLSLIERGNIEVGNRKVEFWLEKQDSAIVLTQDELNEYFQAGFRAGLRENNHGINL